MTLMAAARKLETAIEGMVEPMKTLRTVILARLEDEVDSLETQTRQRIEGIARTLLRRGAHSSPHGGIC